MIKIGLIAPEWSLNRMMDTVREYKSEIEFIPFLFNKTADINDILEKNKSRVNGWLLSGPIPFYFAKWYLKSEEHLVYCRITEAGLLKSILEAAYHHKSFLENVSVDFIEEAGNIDEMLDDLGIPHDKVFIKKFTAPFDEEELLRFHQNLWDEKRICCVITTVPYVYDSLIKAGIPVYAAKVSRMEMLLQVELLIEKIRCAYFKNAQLGLLIIEICHYKKVIEEAGNPYKLQLFELKTQNSILAYCQHISGYMVEKGNGRYEVFGSRGKIENGIAMLKDTMEKMSLELNIPIIAGIGFGDTVLSSQINANKAISHARNKNGIVIFQDDGKIVEPADGQNDLSYSFHSQDEKLNEKLHNANVGIRTYKKMRAIIQSKGIGTFSASVMAEQMGVTARNIRRILSGLLKAGLIECVGEEASGISGRPGKIYRFVN